MKTVIASDLHGSSTYAEKVLSFASEQNADLLVLLGDHFYHGPRNPLPQGYAPMEVARLITEYQGKIVLLQGNCDAEIDEMISPYPLTPHFALFTGGKSIFFTHGHRYNKENPPKGYDILINGHFHTAKIETEKGVIYANPGSPSHPKENTVRGVLVLTDHTLSLYTLEGEERESVSW